MEKLIKKLNSISINLLYKMYKKKINNINVLYTHNNIYGDISIILSSLHFLNKKKQRYFGIKLGKKIKEKFYKYIYKYNLKNYYLNLIFTNFFYIKKIKKIIKIKFNFNKLINKKKNKKKNIIIEFSSPNSNKPLHIGHLRNILIGNTIANIYKLLGYNVIKSQIINDRGIHICKSILSLKKFYNNKLNYNIKGDHFVGQLYIKYEKELQKEIKLIFKKYNIKNYNLALKLSNLFKLANDELIKWEKKDINTIKLWKKINKLVYKGFKETYKKLNIKFDETIYESNIYLLGKKKIFEGIKKKIFFIDKDKSVYFIYKNKKVILLRNNGTSLYITQDIGTILYRYKKYKKMNLLIYVVGNEQNYHFKILFEIIKTLKIPIYNKLYHLSYNTVNLLGKKLKSRYNNKGNIILIDDLIKIIMLNVKKINNKKKELISLGAIKYQFLKINPQKIIEFNIKNILELKGDNGIYIQYTNARFLSIIKKTNDKFNFKYNNIKKYSKIIKNNEKEIIKFILEYNYIIKNTIKYYDPSILTNFIYKFTKKINNFYEKNKIINQKNIYKKNIRLIICKIILNFLNYNMKIIGIPIIKNI